eukprot:c24348_g1_i1 orf=103-1773(+)
MGLYLFIDIIIASSVCFILITILLIKYLGRKMELGLPPSPPAGRPLFGHLHLLQAPLHRSLHKLALTYGPLFYLDMGCVPTIVASSPQWAKEFLHTHDRDFSDRPYFEASKRLFYNSKTVVMMDHGPLWRELRRLYTVQMLTLKRIEMFEEARLEEMAMAMKLIDEGLCNREVEVRKVVSSMVGNMMTRMLFSRRMFSYNIGDTSCGAGHDQAGSFEEMIQEMAVLFGAPVIGDLIPWLAWLDLGGFKKRMNRLALQLDAFLDQVLMARLGESNANNDNIHNGCQINEPANKPDQDFLGLLISMYSTEGEEGIAGKECIKGILLDLLSAGMETTTTTVEWAMAELLRNPNCMRKLQEELNHAKPSAEEDQHAYSHERGNLIRDEDVPKLSYLQAVIKETLRLHPPLPVVVRQMSKSLAHGKEVGGYSLPSKTRLLVNVWALGRDSHTWGEKADHFCPDKFLHPSSPFELRGQHYELLPFGSGRRGCPGMNLGLSMVGLVLANLVRLFEWKLPHDHHTLDLSEAPSRTAPMATPLIATPLHKPPVASAFRCNVLREK